ncbi:MAG: hypothetical protein K2Q09_03625, partial [Phycisphaerales bacterium]|nr:hypothetical protein [Phycisphaerales bacterium]
MRRMPGPASHPEPSRSRDGRHSVAIKRFAVLLAISLACSWIAACVHALFWPPLPVLQAYSPRPNAP